MYTIFCILYTSSNEAMTYHTRQTAIQTVRTATGLSWDTCRKEVNALPKKKDGERYKVLSSDIKNLIVRLTAPVTPIQLSAKNISRIQETA
jgi:hypothetical protein